MTEKAHEGGPEIDIEDVRVSTFCSFCGKPPGQVALMATNGDAAICNHCVTQTRRQMNERLSLAQPSRHVLGRTPESVAVIACGPTAMTWHSSSFHYERKVPKPDEVWTLNKGLRTQRADIGFVLDDLVGEARRSEEYHEDLLRLQIPIITTVIDQDVRALYPNTILHAFPLQQILWKCGVHVALQRGYSHSEIVGKPDVVWRLGQGVGNYFHNSIPMIVAYAWWLGVKRIYLYGADYTFPGQDMREDDRGNAEYWVGGLRFAGMHVVVPTETTLLNQRLQPSLYGYNARPPVLREPTRQEIEQQLLELGQVV